MNKINLKSNLSDSTTCTCISCGACLICIAFLPLLGGVLAPALAGNLTMTKNGSIE